MKQTINLFVSVPISAFSETPSAQEFQQLTLRLLANLRAHLIAESIYCAAEAVQQRGGFEAPAKATEEDLIALEQATHFLLLYPAKLSTSALIELGFALARNIPIVTVTRSRDTLPFMAQGLDSSGRSFSILERDLFDKQSEKKLAKEIVARLLCYEI